MYICTHAVLKYVHYSVYILYKKCTLSNECAVLYLVLSSCFQNLSVHNNFINGTMCVCTHYYMYMYTMCIFDNERMSLTFIVL